MKKFKGLDCVLLVDDEDSNHFLNKLTIKKSNIDVYVQVVFDGLEALEFLSCTGKFSSEKSFPQPGIIFLDINMPRMNGWEFLEKYEKLPSEQKGNIVIAMLTASLNPDDRMRAESKSDLTGFLNKPLSLEQFEAVVYKNFSE